MAWIAENWFFLILLVAFVAMHLFGHGHGHHGPRPPEEGGDARRRHHH